MKYPAWSKRDFRFVAFVLAETIRVLRRVGVSLEDPQAYTTIGRVWADYLRHTNPHFDEERFIEAIRKALTGEDPHL
jgi:trimethylamine:corrinoid methyltransferase-like protein